MAVFNPYNKSIDVNSNVGSHQVAREQEATAFRLAAKGLRDAVDRRSRNAALSKNHDLWSIIQRDLNAPGNKLGPVLKQDCLSLARYSLNYSTRAVLSDLPLDILIDINMQVSEGLSSTSQTYTSPPSITILGQRTPIGLAV